MHKQSHSNDFMMVLGIDWFDYKKQLKKAEQWNVEVYWSKAFDIL